MTAPAPRRPGPPPERDEPAAQPPATVPAEHRAKPAPTYARAFHRSAAGVVSTPTAPAEIAAALADRDGVLWVDIESGNRYQHALLEKVFHFHALAVEDTLNPNSRVKIESYAEDYLFAVLRVARLCDETPDPYDLETVNLNIFLGPNYVVSVHSGPTVSTTLVTDLVTRSPDVLARGAARIAHMIMDAAVDAYFPTLDRIDEFIDGLEERVFERFDERVMQDIFGVKRLVLTLRRYLAPQREVFNVLANRPSPLIPQETQFYFRDVNDHVLRITDSLDNYRELLSTTLDSYLTQVSNRLGGVTKGLTVVATLSVPFVVVSGMWGMNFNRIPLADSPIGFWLMLALQLGLGAGLLVLLRRKRLI